MMLDSTTSNPSSMTVRHLSVCQKETSSETEKTNVLLVEPAMIPRSDREQLLKAANYCVTAVLDVRGMFELRFERPVALAVLNDLLGSFGLRAAAESVRRQWPLAKILVIGCAVPTLEDHLYDDTISHRHEAGGFLDVLDMLTKNSWNQRMVGGHGGYRQAATMPSESDPSKAIVRAPTVSGSPNLVPSAPPRMRATG